MPLPDSSLPPSAEHSQPQSSHAEPAQPAACEPQASDLPRTVIRGESTNPSENNEKKTDSGFLDYFNVTFPLRGELHDVVGQVLTGFYATAGMLCGAFEDRRRGLHGWTQSFASTNGGIALAVGGQRNTGFLSLPGEGCALVQDWDALARFLRDDLKAKITRADAAHDDFLGTHSVDEAACAYLDGKFKVGGRQPKHDTKGDWLNPQGEGRTLYVGSRESGKLYRGYEKGKQLGDRSSLWVRHEVEWHNEGRVIPWDIVWNPGKYLAGAYPYLGWVSEESTRIQTIQKTATTDTNVLKDHCKRTYGKLVNQLVEAGFSDKEIVRDLRRAGTPRRLIVPTLLGVHGERQ
jgi:phage replication initiation protein